MIAIRAILPLCVLTLGACAPSYYSADIARGPAVPGIAVDAKQRFVWTPTMDVRTLDKADAKGDTYKVAPRAIVCAEPSPDTASAFAAELSAAVKVSTPKVDVESSVSRSLTESLQALTQRSEMLQLLRDGYYRICEAYANGMVGEFGYGLVLNQIDDIIVKMVAINAIKENRPLPDDPTDRAKLADAEGARVKLDGARRRYDDAQADLRTAENRLTAARSAQAGAIAAKAGADKLAADLKAAIDDTNTPAADKPGLRARWQQADADAAFRNQYKTEADGTHAAAQKSVTDLTALRDTARQAVIAAEGELAEKTRLTAAIVRQPFSVHALDTIEKITSRSAHSTTVAGACLMWLSQRRSIEADDKSLIVQACKSSLETAARRAP